MKIYLCNKRGWKLYDNPLSEELLNRNIRIGNSVKIGDFAKIRNFADIGDFAEIGSFAEIGDSVEIRDFVKIGSFQQVTQTALDFSVENIYQQLNILPDQNNIYTMYKCVSPTLTSFFDENSCILRDKVGEMVLWRE